MNFQDVVEFLREVASNTRSSDWASQLERAADALEDPIRFLAELELEDIDDDPEGGGSVRA